MTDSPSRHLASGTDATAPARRPGAQDPEPTAPLAAEGARDAAGSHR